MDERRDPEKATRAAAKYLLDLYKQFGSWYLAAASYNCGEGRVQRELNQSNHKNFWELSANMCLPTETKNYVPQMIAATIIAKNPEKFGFKNVPYLPPVKYDKVPVTETTSLTAAAVAVNVPAEEVADLNPELLRGVTPPDAHSYTLNLPPSSKELFYEKYYHRPHRASGGGLPPDPDGQELRTVLFQRQELCQTTRPACRVHQGQRGPQVQRQEPEFVPRPPRRPRAGPMPNRRNRPKAPQLKPAAGHVVQASLFGTPSLASKSQRRQEDQNGPHRHRQDPDQRARPLKARNPARPGWRKRAITPPRVPPNPRKPVHPPATPRTNKYSQSKSKRAIMVSEAR